MALIHSEQYSPRNYTFENCEEYKSNSVCFPEIKALGTRNLPADVQALTGVKKDNLLKKKSEFERILKESGM